MKVGVQEIDREGPISLLDTPAYLPHRHHLEVRALHRQKYARQSNNRAKNPLSTLEPETGGRKPRSTRLFFPKRLVTSGSNKDLFSGNPGRGKERGVWDNLTWTRRGSRTPQRFNVRSLGPTCIPRNFNERTGTPPLVPEKPRRASLHHSAAARYAGPFKPAWEPAQRVQTLHY